VTLLEAERRKCEFLQGWTEELPNLEVLWGRAEEQPLETYGVAVAKALAPPPVAAEWCLPLVEEGGAAVLWVGPSADADVVARAAERLAAELSRRRVLRPQGS
jgi:16S rRNA (guanine527-N7)-methyltransferase